jgi:RNA polymerase sigma-70 factor (ECF subfamily)
MLGSSGEADDAVQETWLRISRADVSEIENFGGWLTTIVSRISLDILRSRASRREEPLAPDWDNPEPSFALGADPEHESLLADAVGPALLVVLDTLGPAERLAFVLHDLFGVPFDEIAPIVGRSPAAARQLASRARRRVRGMSTSAENVDQIRQQAIVDAFLAASRDGEFAELVRLLDPEVVLRADQTAVAMGAAPEIRGARDVAGRFAAGARVARLALIDGVAGAVWMAGRRPRIVFRFGFSADRIAAIEIIADPEHLQSIDVVTYRNSAQE